MADRATAEAARKAANGAVCDDERDDAPARDELEEQQGELRDLKDTLRNEQRAARAKGNHGRARRLGHTIQDVQTRQSHVKALLRADREARQEVNRLAALKAGGVA
jgi:hypothetical protein